MPIFPQNVIAIIWDFDKTLVPGNMEGPLFRKYEIEESHFWEEVDGLTDYYRHRGADLVARDSLYLNHILTYVREGRMAGLTNGVLRELGAEIDFYDGIPHFFEQVRKQIEADPRFAEHGITVEHYIVSSGLRQMILGSAVAQHIEYVWACEFIEEIAPPGYLDEAQDPLFGDGRAISQLIYTIDNTTKTRAVFEINKGTNKNSNIHVNAKVAYEDRRVPFQNMIYIADGPSDVPVFSILNQHGGRTFAVYRPGSPSEFEQVDRLLAQDRIQAYGPADYTDGTQTSMWITNAATQIARRIVRDRDQALSERLGKPPTHIEGD